MSRAGRLGFARAKILDSHLLNSMDSSVSASSNELLNDPVRLKIVLLLGDYHCLSFEELLKHLKTVQPLELKRQLEILSDLVIETRDEYLLEDTAVLHQEVDRVYNFITGTSNEEFRNKTEPIAKYVLTEAGHDVVDEVLSGKKPKS